ncbi:hypothetical protein, partial [Testudinibacter sp. TR-2022]|uniref:hypothetical protein n=1 Tax=Testudinibacter sp. TR-2022 TaxID=2585029 RepID=UPI0022775EBC
MKNIFIKKLFLKYSLSIFYRLRFLILPYSIIILLDAKPSWRLVLLYLTSTFIYLWIFYVENKNLLEKLTKSPIVKILALVCYSLITICINIISREEVVIKTGFSSSNFESAIYPLFFIVIFLFLPIITSLILLLLAFIYEVKIIYCEIKHHQ